MPQSDGLYFAPGPEPNHLRLSMAINLSWLLPSKHPLVGVAYRFSPLCVQKMLVTGLVLVRHFSVREPDRKWWTKNIGLDFSSRLRDEPQRDGGLGLRDWNFGGVLVRHRAGWMALVCLASFPCAATAQVQGQLASGRNQPSAGPADDGTSKIVATDLICVVNGEHVLAGDVFSYIDNIIEENRKSVPKGQEDVFAARCCAACSRSMCRSRSSTRAS